MSDRPLFYKLTHPDYETDAEAARRNPAQYEPLYHLPSVRCGTCGTWASGDRLRIPLSEEAKREFKGYRFPSPEEWKAGAPHWARLLSVEEKALSPGAAVGPPSGFLHRSGHLPPVLHPFPGIVWVDASVHALLRFERFKGVWFAEVELFKGPKVRLWEVVVTGKAWRVGASPEAQVDCSECGSVRFLKLPMVVDLERWDGSDFFNLDGNPNIIVVTGAVREALLDVDNVHMPALK